MTEVRLPRIFVGTLASGEAEFEACCAAIASQTGVHITHHIIENQPEYEAHNMLWQAWAENKTSHDIFIKIDADTVLNRKTAILEIFNFFTDPRVTGIQAELNDYFTDEIIVGPLTGFSSKVEFRPAKSKLFVDHADYGHDVILKGKQLIGLNPVGWHGQNPSAKQSFHFGFHRKLKGQDSVIKKTALAWLKLQDDSRGWALAGAASVRWWMRGKTHYKSKSFKKCFEKNQNPNERRKMIEKFIRKNYEDLI